MIDRASIEVPEAVPSVAGIRRQLLRRVGRALLGRGEALRGRTVLRVEVPADAVDLFPWLRGQHGVERLYWAGRSDGREVAASGAACVVAAQDGADYGALQRRMDDVLLGAGPGSIRLRPSLSVTEAEIDLLIHKLDSCLTLLSSEKDYFARASA